MAYESRFLTVPHEISFESGLACHGLGCRIQAACLHARACVGLHPVADLYRALMSLFGKFACALGHECASHVGHISGIIAVDVNHHGVARAYDRAVAPYRQRRVEPLASHREVVWGRRIGIFSHEHIAHVKFHGVAADTELSEAPFETRYALDLDLKLQIGHPLVIKMRYAAVNSLLADAAQAYFFDLGRRLDRAQAAHGRREVDYLRAFEHFGKALGHAPYRYVEFKAETSRSVESDGQGHIFGLADRYYSIAFKIDRPTDEIYGNARCGHVDVSVEHSAGQIVDVGVVGDDHCVGFLCLHLSAQIVESKLSLLRPKNIERFHFSVGCPEIPMISIPFRVSTRMTWRRFTFLAVFPIVIPAGRSICIEEPIP